MASLTKETTSSNYPHGFAGGVTIKGVPLTVTNPGKTFWVDENAKSPSNTKGTWSNPANSIENCMDLCVANRGDIIMVKPGHVENLGAAAALTFDVAGVTVVGTGRGGKQAKIEWDTATGAIADIEADNVSICNMWMHANFANVTVGWNVAADYFTIEGCRITDGSSTLEWVAFVQIADDADYFSFIGNDVRLYTGSTTNAVVATTGESVGMRVTGNFVAACGVTALFDLDAEAITGYPIFRDNVLMNLDTTTGKIVTIDAATVGLFANNMTAMVKANVMPIYDMTASLSINNKGTDAANTWGIVFPETTAT